MWLKREPGGIKVDEALTRAEAALHEIRDHCLTAIDRKLDAIALHERRRQLNWQRQCYLLANQVCAEAAPFGLTELSDVADNRCEVLPATDAAGRLRATSWACTSTRCARCAPGGAGMCGFSECGRFEIAASWRLFRPPGGPGGVRTCQIIELFQRHIRRIVARGARRIAARQGIPKLAPQRVPKSRDTPGE